LRYPQSDCLADAGGEGGKTVAEAVAHAAATLGAAGIPEPRREARLLVAAALGIEPATVLGWPERQIAEGPARRLAELVSGRAAHAPVSRLLGRREFWSLSFALSPGTLDPRPDSETLVEAALAEIAVRTAPLRVLDLGTGTGCLLLALLSELPNATGVGVDLAPGAVATARRNAAALGLARRASFIAGDWGTALVGRHDVILANPPYISTQAIEGLPPEVGLYDPRLALDGGADGLSAYRALAGDLRRLSEPHGAAVVELGEGQAPAVAAIMAAAGLAVRGVRQDLAGIERAIVLTPVESKQSVNSRSKKLLERSVVRG
jgi:release factor glutamine methyltransferase